MSDDAPSSSPAYSALLKTLLAKTKKITPLSPSASPGTKKQRAEDYQTLAEISSIIESNRKQEQAAADDDEPPVDPVLSRFKAIVPVTPFNVPVLSAADFRDLLLSPPPNKSSDLEDAAFRRLFAGFSDTQEAWVDALQHLLVERRSWVTLCERSSSNDSLKNVDQQLINSLSLQPALDKGVQFVDYVLRTIELLKFIRLWTSRDEERKWKSTYLDNACRNDNEPLYLERDAASPGGDGRCL
ncbi:hypothetical protein B0H11DRAFT_2228166 [Mycena galericulata]|nr:hypothetical protein B0H11DRAFT_2228166 [Mycena galericulata]